jgi:hypothetical protein
MRKYLRFLALPILALTAGCGGGSGPGTGGNPQPPFGVTSDHVFVVVLENHGFAQVNGSPAMPYLNSLAAGHALATNYFANTHPSIGNYFMLTTGALESNDDNFTGMVTDNNVVRVLNAAGKTWKSYAESIPSTGYLGTDSGIYIKHHNPFAYISDVVNSPSQAANLVPFSQLSADLSAGSLPSFGFIIPNDQDNAHDCPGGAATCLDTDKLTAADNWLKANIDPLITSPKFGNSVVIIVWDESVATDLANIGGQVSMVMVGPQVRTGFKSGTFFDHRATLRVALNLLGVPTLPNGAATANSMREFFP